jgi:hypothetical protein
MKTRRGPARLEDYIQVRKATLESWPQVSTATKASDSAEYHNRTIAAAASAATDTDRL